MKAFINTDKTLILFSIYFEKNSDRLRSQHAIGLLNYVGANMRVIHSYKSDVAPTSTVAKFAARPSPIPTPPQNQANKPHALAPEFLTPKKK